MKDNFKEVKDKVKDKLRILGGYGWAYFFSGFYLSIMATVFHLSVPDYLPFLLRLYTICVVILILFERRGYEWLPKPILLVIELLFLVGCLPHVLFMGIVLKFVVEYPEEEPAAYLLVMGAEVIGKRPSLTLLYRIERAAQYLREHPDTKAVVSGGRNRGADISQAEVMYELLIDLGIDKDRIYKEDQSRSAEERAVNCVKCIEEAGGDIKTQHMRILTTDCNTGRAIEYACSKGIADVVSEGVETLWYLIPTSYMTEFFMFFMDIMADNYGYRKPPDDDFERMRHDFPGILL